MKIETSEWYGFHIQTNVKLNGEFVGHVTLDPPGSHYTAYAVVSSTSSARKEFAVYDDAVRWVAAEHARIVVEKYASIIAAASTVSQ